MLYYHQIEIFNSINPFHDGVIGVYPKGIDFMTQQSRQNMHLCEGGTFKKGGIGPLKFMPLIKCVPEAGRRYLNLNFMVSTGGMCLNFQGPVTTFLIIPPSHNYIFHRLCCVMEFIPLRYLDRLHHGMNKQILIKLIKNLRGSSP